MTALAVVFDTECHLAVMAGPTGLPLCHPFHTDGLVLLDIFVEFRVAFHTFQPGRIHVGSMTEEHRSPLVFHSDITAADTGKGNTCAQQN